MSQSINSPRHRLAFACLAFGLGGPVGPVAAAESGDDYNEHELEEVVVTGVPLGRTIEELAQPTSVVAGDDLAKKQAASLGETLSHELGVSSTYFGPVASRPVIRGQYGERIRVLSNSLDSMDASALSEDHATSVDAMLAERIEIIRGPATLLYGSGAAGGLVNVVDNRILEESLSEPIQGFVSLGTDSATGKEAVAGEIAFGTDWLAFHFDYFNRQTDDVEIPGFAESALLRSLEEEAGEGEEEEAFGTVENTAGETEGGAAAATLVGENGYVGVAFSGYDSLYGVPGHHHDDDSGGAATEELVRIDLEQTRVDLQSEYRFTDAGALRLKLAHNDYQHTELEGDEIGTLFNSTGTDARLEYQHPTIGNVEGAIGIQHKYVDFEAIGDEAFVPASVTRQTSLFVFEEWLVDDRWTVQGSARIEQQGIDAPNLPGYDDEAFGASLGVVRSFGDDYTLALNYALTERHPNSAELYADGAHVAVQRVERGSVTQGDGLFGKETSSNVDLTLRGEAARVEWAITAFLNEIDNYVLLSPTALVEDELQVFNYTQTDARLYGLEAEARIELLDSADGHLHSRLFTDYVRGTEQNGGGNLPRITPLRYGIGLHYTRNGFEAAVEAMFSTEQDRIATNELPTDSYTLLSAELSYAFDDPQLFVFLRGTNLSDQDARQHTSPLKEILPLPGRSLQLGLRYDF